MDNLPRPGTPQEDLADRKSPALPPRQGLLTADLVALAQGGVSVILASCGAEGKPIAGIGVGARVDEAGTIRVFLTRQANLPLLKALEDGRAIAVTFSRARDHVSFQVKANGASILQACPDDTPEIARQSAVFRDELIGINLPKHVAEGFTTYDPGDLLAIEFTPEAAFVQTPGPGAGSPLSP
ncbi:hypothetical protein [Roseibium aggregatum]|uniref:Uncharacterized protein n=1 Tax=Roseibium aggregatum TaxID=187304 RepID=A0A926P4H5_9HYPH|nr:hypothetical protein [Roseibium aggregatum]MBD1549268.1 hypothetical protein [Roseibium aggregatum]